MKKYAFGLVLILVSSIAYAQMKAEPEGDGPSCSVILEPIYSSGPPVANPCGIAVGDTATFIAKVSPSSISDNAVKWESSSSCNSFVGGSRGRLIQVKGNHTGDAALTLSVDGHEKPHSNWPTITFQILEKSTVDVHVRIIRRSDGTGAVTDEDSVRSLLSGVNSIYKQIAMEFELASIGYIDDSAYFSPNANGRSNLVNTLKNTGGLEVYFVASLGGTLRAAESRTNGIVVQASKATARIIAHEIGHACGLLDIYNIKSVETHGGIRIYSTSDVGVKKEYIPLDWNSGPPDGPAYYASNLDMFNLIKRLLMYGKTSLADHHDGGGSDISAGNVWGINEEETDGSYFGEIPVGHSAMNRFPKHN